LCPFSLTYKWSDDQEEFYMAGYDEMHNHVLEGEAAIIPYPKQTVVKPSFQTPMFFRFQTFKVKSLDELKAQVV
jgi:hypothetical protein